MESWSFEPFARCAAQHSHLLYTVAQHSRKMIKHRTSVRSPLFGINTLNDVVEGVGEEFYVMECVAGRVLQDSAEASMLPV